MREGIGRSQPPRATFIFLNDGAYSRRNANSPASTLKFIFWWMKKEDSIRLYLASGFKKQTRTYSVQPSQACLETAFCVSQNSPGKSECYLDIGRRNQMINWDIKILSAQKLRDRRQWTTSFTPVTETWTSASNWCPLFMLTLFMNNEGNWLLISVLRIVLDRVHSSRRYHSFIPAVRFIWFNPNNFYVSTDIKKIILDFIYQQGTKANMTIF